MASASSIRAKEWQRNCNGIFECEVGGIVHQCVCLPHFVATLGGESWYACPCPCTCPCSTSWQGRQVSDVTHFEDLLSDKQKPESHSLKLNASTLATSFWPSPHQWQLATASCLGLLFGFVSPGLVIILIDIDDVVGESCRCGLLFYLQQSRNILSGLVDSVATVASGTHLAWGI
ncbi:hypothetical protein ACLKA6_003365 [Drosophila palustris]